MSWIDWNLYVNEISQPFGNPVFQLWIQNTLIDLIESSLFLNKYHKYYILQKNGLARKDILTETFTLPVKSEGAGRPRTMSMG